MQAYRYKGLTVEKFDEHTNTFVKDREYLRSSLSQQLVEVLDANPGKPIMLGSYTDRDWRNKYDPKKELLYFPET